MGNSGTEKEGVEGKKKGAGIGLVMYFLKYKELWNWVTQKVMKDNIEWVT